MTSIRTVSQARLKLVALMAIFALPMLVAWGMVFWGVGIPEERTAHGELSPDIPMLAEWPLSEQAGPLVEGDWVLAFDCGERCEVLTDQWWRVHRALGREAPRVSRLRIGGPADALPGERIVQWSNAPQWRKADTLWILDPAGHPVLTYTPEADPSEVLDDLNQLLRMNPEVGSRDVQDVAQR
ncbi:hypothetical protein [Halomonas urumqiensis]|uniref:Thioredoxin domain-containing protein n=1 Tax=Halomonas urumqiensis TaxID=1684789 RepID=A0A2N7UPQ9_9GAMM|nr:hypothetical protein [Halomonas urumqiensis]PMR82427.1 hypothetical protein C1H70_01525 [Halomonas urumqiensis]PTB04092.1 hypothetical protein C6V82_06475 [Halomonas urumqiensis]GHE19643.1 hypothetical protein GCM10017767_01640 [Halomonas urumqiensis]